ncbi:hypothetical protein GF314_07425 [bacterium]|nr:hypothetical protein [bacterium]
MIARTWVVLGLALVAAAAAAPADVPDWEAHGPDGVTATGLFWDEYRHPQYFLATGDGYWLHDASTGEWTSFEEPGVPGREVTALDGVPGLDHRLLTGRRDADGHGIIEMSFPLLGDEILTVYEGQAGPVARIEVTGYLDPVGLAAIRSLDEVPGALIASVDSGATWSEIAGHGHHDVTDVSITDVVPQWDGGEFYVSGDAGVMFTADGGETWEPRDDGLPAGTVHRLWLDGPALVVPPGRTEDARSFLYATLDDGLYFTETDELDWRRVLAGPATRVTVRQRGAYGYATDVFVVTADGRLLHAVEEHWEWEDWTGSLAGETIVGVVSSPPRLVVATAGGGLSSALVDFVASDAPDADLAPRLRAAPSPFNPRTVLSFEAPRSGHARLTMHDVRGRRVATLLDGTVAAGSNRVTWQPRDLASGVYLARLRLGGATTSCRVVLVE